MSRFQDIQQILDRVLGGRPAANHGVFWQGVSRDQFVAREVFGLKMVVPGEPGKSWLMGALKGNPPFAVDDDDLTARPPASEKDIEIISSWIADGCPDVFTAPSGASAHTFGITGGVSVSDADHVRYWRGVDFFFLPGLSSAETGTHVARMHMSAFFAWKASHLLGGDAGVWETYIAKPEFQESFAYVRHHYTRLIEEAYGSSQDNLFDSLWKFGANLLPPDPQVAIPSRRTMNSQLDWFFWVPYIEMSLRVADTGDADLRLGRAWQVGIAADGLIRNRFVIPEFDAGDPAVEQTVKASFETSQPDVLIAGMQSRAQNFETSPFFSGWPGPNLS